MIASKDVNLNEPINQQTNFTIGPNNSEMESSQHSVSTLTTLTSGRRKNLTPEEKFERRKLKDSASQARKEARRLQRLESLEQQRKLVEKIEDDKELLRLETERARIDSAIKAKRLDVFSKAELEKLKFLNSQPLLESVGSFDPRESKQPSHSLPETNALIIHAEQQELVVQNPLIGNYLFTPCLFPFKIPLILKYLN